MRLFSAVRRKPGCRGSGLNLPGRWGWLDHTVCLLYGEVAYNCRVHTPPSGHFRTPTLQSLGVGSVLALTAKAPLPWPSWSRPTGEFPDGIFP